MKSTRVVKSAKKLKNTPLFTFMFSEETEVQGTKKRGKIREDLVFEVLA